MNSSDENIGAESSNDNEDISPTSTRQSSSTFSSYEKLNDFTKGTTVDIGKCKRICIKKQKSQSFQDLHSDYTKKRYQHVKSKVKQYIDNIREQDLRRKKIIHRASLPLQLNQNELENTDCDFNSMDDDKNISQKLFDKNQEISRLKLMTEYLQNDLQEKREEITKLKRNSESSRIELFLMKEKERQKKLNINAGILRYNSSPKNFKSLNILRNNNKVTKSTQTENLNSNINTSNEFVTINLRNQRRALHFNEEKTDEDDESIYNSSEKSYPHKNISIKSDIIDEISKIEQTPKIKNSRRKKFKKKYLKFFFGTCPCTDINTSIKNEYPYTLIPLSDSFIEQHN